MSGAAKRRPQRRRWIAGATEKAEADARAAEKRDAERAMVRHREAKALELPIALVEWRRGRERRAITRHADGGVTLTEPTGPLEWREARFPSVEAAAAAVTPAIRWAVRERVVGYAAVAKLRQDAAKSHRVTVPRG